MTDIASNTISDGTETARPGVGSDVPPHAVLWELATVAAVSRCLHAVARLGVADALDPAADASVHDLAASLDLDADALGRVLRALAAYGVFDVALPNVRHTDASRLLRGDHPASMREFAHMMGLPMSWDALEALPTTVATGRAGIFDLDPEGLFSYLRNHPDQAAVFDHAMTAKSQADIRFVVESMDLPATGRVVDVAGGRGHLLRSILDRHPGIDATLVELPDVIERLVRDGAPPNIELRAADIFTDRLPRADTYILMEILHDWDDTDAVRILSNLRANAPDGARVLVIETVLDGQRRRDPAKTLDIVMLAVTGGRERTASEHGSLLQRAGWHLMRVVPTGGAVQIVVARTAEAGR